MATWSSLDLDQVTPPNRIGNGQGYFRYYRPDGTFDSIVAVNGKLLRNGGDLPITGLASGFQKDRMIEAVQYQDKLYIATGTKFVVYDGVTAKVVDAYRPQPLEAIYVGTNALADNPDDYLQDGIAQDPRIDGVTVDKRYGVVNQTSTFTAYVSIPAGLTLKYAFQYRRIDSNTLTEPSFEPVDGSGKPIWQDSKVFKFTPKSTGVYEFQVLICDAADVNRTVLSSYNLPEYKVTQYNENPIEDTSTIHSCNRILLHWDRLILYGDPSNRNMIYISHLQNPAYFPTNNTLRFETDKQEPITKLVQYRDFIVAFLPASIQGLYGKSPQEYTRTKIQTGIGCIAPESACVFGNYIAFLSKEGVFILKSFGNNETRLNVERIDTKIANLIPPYPESGDASAVAYRDQYHLCFPSRKTRFRFYREQGHWTRDESPYFDIARFYEWRGDLVIQRQSTGEVYQFDDNVYDDAGYVYEDRIETKSYDFKAPYNPKKLKQLQLLIGHDKADANLGVYVYGDNATLISPDTSYITLENGEVKYVNQFEDNVQSDSGSIFGDWELGVDELGEVRSKIHKIRLVGGRKYRSARVLIRHQEAKPYILMGLGFIFKLRKP